MTQRPDRGASTNGAVVRVLVLDHNADAADTLVSILSLESCDTRAIYDARALPDVAADFRPHVVIVNTDGGSREFCEERRRVARELTSDPRLGGQPMRFAALTWEPRDEPVLREAGYDGVFNSLGLDELIEFVDVARALAAPCDRRAKG